MRLIEDIEEEIRKNESEKITNIIIQYHDLEGDNFFEKMDFFRCLLKVLHKEFNVILLEDIVRPKKHWLWDLPIYFDQKFKFIQFNLIRAEVTDTIECGSIWSRPVDGTVIQIQAIEGQMLYVKVLEGPGITGDSLNQSVLKIFWNKKRY